MDNDHYSVLGLTRYATASEIKKSYHSMALRLHPDKNPNGSTEVAFKRVATAYAVLSDATQKVAYDSKLYSQAMNGTGLNYASRSQARPRSAQPNYAARARYTQYGPNVGSTGRPFSATSRPASATARPAASAPEPAAAPSRSASPPQSAFGDTSERINADRQQASNLPRSSSVSGYSFTQAEKDELDALHRRYRNAQNVDASKWDDIRRHHERSAAQTPGSPEPPARRRPQSAFTPRGATKTNYSSTNDKSAYVSEESVNDVLDALRKARQQVESSDRNSARNSYNEIKKAYEKMREEGGSENSEMGTSTSESTDSPTAAKHPSLRKDKPAESTPTSPTPPSTPNAAARRPPSATSFRKAVPRAAPPSDDIPSVSSNGDEPTSDMPSASATTTVREERKPSPTKRPQSASATRSTPPLPTVVPSSASSSRPQSAQDHRGTQSIPADSEIAGMGADELRSLMALLEHKTKLVRQSLLLSNIKK